MFELIGEAFSARWALIGAGAIFHYVGAEVAIGAQMALFLNAEGIWGISLQQAGALVSCYWAGAFAGRLVGSALLYRFKVHLLLMLFTAMAALMCLYLFGVGGITAGYVALVIGLVNSIMFPVVFTLTLERSTASEEAISAMLCTGIVGGAAVPFVLGAVSEVSSYGFAFIVPAGCYALLCLFAVTAGRSAPIHRSSARTVH